MNCFRLLIPAVLVCGSVFPKTVIVTPKDPTPLEMLAAHEVRRYWYLRTGELAAITGEARLPRSGAIVLARRATESLSAEQYSVKSAAGNIYLVGGDEIGTLYAAYRFAERLGVRFYLHGDVVPDKKISPRLPQVGEIGKPLFGVRGIQPFHDFPEGPDWWNVDDYLSHIAQLPKLRMNFLGLHNYPEGSVGPEPGVWIGQPRDFDLNGKVSFSYPSRWANTAREGMWGYAAMSTSDFSSGADQLFAETEYGPAVMKDMMPAPRTPRQSDLLFDNTGSLFRTAFASAKSLGVKTCFGTETPLTIPKLVQERLRSEGKDPKDPSVVREVYEGIFRRIAATYPLDYYWLWTLEDWTWGGNKTEQFELTAADIRAASDALNAIGRPFTLATSGWVLGPQHDRAALDRLLPKDSPMSAINRQVGHAPVEPGFALLQGRPKWAIPWVENDPNLTAPQPWVGRMRYDAADARRLGCTGLLGIHWRTKILAPNMAALAAAAWEQPWIPSDFSAKPLDLPAVLQGEGQNENPLRPRTMPVEDFYIDFARANFGDAVAIPAGKLFAGIDGAKLPEPATWIKGPGGIKVDKTPWSERSKQYAFVAELAALRPSVNGAGNLERFDYWLNTYRYMAALAEVGSLRGELDARMASVTTPQAAAAALDTRVRLSRAWERMITLQIMATDTPGELGTLANLEQHNRKFLRFLDAHDEALAKALAAPLPDSVRLSQTYTGPPRVVVPTVRTSASKGESLSLTVLAPSREPAKGVAVYWRVLGEKEFQKIAAKHTARAVYRAQLAPASDDFEYYVEVEASSGAKLHWPATAPSLNQTVVVY
jgi:hypothetical protein